MTVRISEKPVVAQDAADKVDPGSPVKYTQAFSTRGR